MSSVDNTALPTGAGNPAGAGVTPMAAEATEAADAPGMETAPNSAESVTVVAAGETPAPVLPLRVLCGLPDPRVAASLPALPPFDPRVTAFLAEVSAALLADPRARAYPDVTSFAFFCRKASLRQLQAPYTGMAGRLGRGLVFHIAPGNVPMNFAYSLAAGLLAGNANVVKASSRRFAQVELTCEAMRAQLAGAHRTLAGYVNVVEYPRERQDVTEALSALCDARVIWGGDETIRRVREAPFYVLMGAKMPSILVEIGYITNATEAKRLTSKTYLDALADGLVQGVISYKRQIERYASL